MEGSYENRKKLEILGKRHLGGGRRERQEQRSEWATVWGQDSGSEQLFWLMRLR